MGRPGPAGEAPRRVSKAWDKGSTRAWRRVRAAVLARDHHTCQLRLPGCTGHATHVHHTRGRATTGDDPTYLVAACAHCNLALGEPTPDPPSRGGTQW
jgi:5-methylcytosine-specific restriction endonuclease McrA